MLRHKGLPRFRLLIAGRDFTGRCEGIEATYADDAGGSEITFTCYDDLSGYENAEVRLQVGYDGEGEALVDWAVGELQRVIPNSDGSSACSALGPFSLMASQYFAEQVDYTGYRLPAALYDICSRAGYPLGVAVVRGGDNILIQDASFTEDTTLSEGAQSLLENTNFVATDLPGGIRMFMPRPRPGAKGKSTAQIDPSDYPAEGGLQLADRYGGRYSQVVVYRLSDATDSSGRMSYEVYAKAPVHLAEPLRYRAPKNRIYYVTDFAGDQDAASQQAYDLARSLGSGEVQVTVSGIPIMPEIERYSQVTLVREVERKDGTHRETYEVVLENSVGISIQNWSMDLDGYGILTDDQLISPVRIEVPPVSPAVLNYAPKSGLDSKGVYIGEVTAEEEGISSDAVLLDAEGAYLP